MKMLLGLIAALAFLELVAGQMMSVCDDSNVAPVQTFLRRIVGPCSHDIRKCPSGHCVCQNGNPGVICPVTETVSVDCGAFGVHDVLRVTSCACCSRGEILVRGTVVDSSSENVLPDKQVRFNGEFIAITDAEGRFSGPISQGASPFNLVIAVTDESGIYADAVRVFDLPAYTVGPVSIKIPMILRSEPQAVNAQERTTLRLGEGEAGTIVIEENALRYENDEPFEGVAYVSITFADASREGSDDRLQGRFLTAANEPLASDGMVSIDMKDNSGQKLVGALRFQVREGMKLWSLNPRSGKWDSLESNGKRKRRRRQASVEEILALISNARWVNIDKFVGWPVYYYKAKVFYEDPADAANGPFFTPSTLVFHPLNQRLQIYNPGTYTPDTECFEVRAIPFNVASPADVCTGLIGLKAQEDIVVGGVNVFLQTKLEAKALSDYSTSIQTAHNYIEYAVTPSDTEILLKYKSSPTGGIYETLSDCQASTITDPAFHFIKPRLPTYIPYPDTIDACTARVHFAQEMGFHDALDGLATLPTVHAVSMWTQGSAFYYTATTTMQYSTVYDFYYACVEYRCSETASLTEVYIVIDIPTVANATGHSQPLFQCECYGSACNSGYAGTTFTPSELASGYAGPDYYTPAIANDCADRTDAELFAHTMYCWDY